VHFAINSVFQPGVPSNVLAVGLSSFLHIFGLFVDVFLHPSPLPSPSPLLTQCEGCLEDYVGAHGWVAGNACHGSIILSRGWLVTVEAPGYPRHPSSIQHDAVVKYHWQRTPPSLLERKLS